MTTTDLIVIDDEKVALIKRTVAQDATDDELDLFLHQARRMGLDPLARQIHFQKYNTKDGPRVSFITTIDGYRLIADRTGKYAGSDEPEFEGEIKDKNYGGGPGPNIPAKATVTVHKIVGGTVRPFSNSAYWQEYYPGYKRGHMWRKMPHVMLAKVAEAGALRKAFPADLSGAYTADEMSQAGVEVIDSEPPKIDTMRELKSLAVVVDHETEEVIEVEDDGPTPIEPPRKKANGNGTNGKHPTKAMIKDLHVLGTSVFGKEWNKKRAEISATFGVTSSKDWSLDDYFGVIANLEELQAAKGE
jgi:phage recombination protein Bet